MVIEQKMKAVSFSDHLEILPMFYWVNTLKQPIINYGNIFL